MPVRSRIRRRGALRGGGICLLLAILALSPAPAQAGSTSPEDLSSGRVIRSLAYTLAVRYGKSVTVEEPNWQWDGDFVVVGRHPEQPSVTLREVKSRHMELPPWLNLTDTPTLNADVISRLLDEYRIQNPTDVPYRVVTSKLGFHILPLQEHDANGELVSARPLLDTVVTVPWAKRLASEHFQELVRALTAASGTTVVPADQRLNAVFGANGLRPPKFWSSVEEKAPYSFEWSVDAKTAREALLDLWGRSASSLTWSLLCAPPERDHPKGICYLSLMGLPQRDIQPDGRVGYKATLFDRVATKPEFLPLPAEQR